MTREERDKEEVRLIAEIQKAKQNIIRVNKNIYNEGKNIKHNKQ